MLKSFQGAPEVEDTPDRPGIFKAASKESVVANDAPICVQQESQVDIVDEEQNYHQEEFEPYEEMGQVMPDDYAQENRVGAEY